MCLKYQEETLLFVFYYFATTQAEASIKRTTAPIYKKFTIKIYPIISLYFLRLD